MVVIFDLDGTLLDTIYDIADAMNEALVFYGYAPSSPKEYIDYIGSGVNQLTLRAMHQEIINNDFENIKARYIENYKKNQLNKTKPFDNMVETLIELKKRGNKLACISNKPDSDVKKMIAYYFDGLFDYVLGFKTEKEKKPNPITLEYAKDYFKVSKDEMVYVGDSRYDYQYANNFNIKLIMCRYGYEKKEVLDSYKGLIFIDKPEDLLKEVK